MTRTDAGSAARCRGAALAPGCAPAAAPAPWASRGAARGGWSRCAPRSVPAPAPREEHGAEHVGGAARTAHGNARWPWTTATRLDRATADLDPPFAVVDLDAFDANAADLVRRAGGKPIRVASKSVRCRALLDRVLARAGFRGDHGVHAARGAVAARPRLRRPRSSPTRPPTAPRCAELAADDARGRRDHDHGRRRRAARPRRRGRAARGARADPRLPRPRRVLAAAAAGGCTSARGARRVHSPAQAAALAREVVARAGLPAGRAHGLRGADRRRRRRAARQARCCGAAIRAMQRRSAARAARSGAPRRRGRPRGRRRWSSSTAAAPAASSATARRGRGHRGRRRLGPLRPDAVRRLPRASRRGPPRCSRCPSSAGPAPASRPCSAAATSPPGPAGADRLPLPYLPAGLRARRPRGRGRGADAAARRARPTALRVGDRVWFRHAKAGELCERFDALHLVDGDAVPDVVPTYRGEGSTFL